VDINLDLAIAGTSVGVCRLLRFGVLCFTSLRLARLPDAAEVMKAHAKIVSAQSKRRRPRVSE
jgi:hypothetical protein